MRDHDIAIAVVRQSTHICASSRCCGTVLPVRLRFQAKGKIETILVILSYLLAGPGMEKGCNYNMHHWHDIHSA